MSNKDRHAASEAFRQNVVRGLELVSEERQASYGNAEESFQRIATFWEAYWRNKGIEVPFSAIDVAHMMHLFKLSREMFRHSFDNILDGANYLAFAGGFAAADEVLADKEEETEEFLEYKIPDDVAETKSAPPSRAVKPNKPIVKNTFPGARSVKND